MPIPELIKQLIALHGITDEIREHTIYIYWRDMVGRRIADHAWPDSVSSGVLVVGAQNSSWLHELHFVRAHIIEQVNQCLEAWLGPPTFVSDIRLTLDRQRDAVKPDELRRQLKRRHGRAKPPPSNVPIAASEAEQQAIRAETIVVEDDSLRTVIERLRINWSL